MSEEMAAKVTFTHGKCWGNNLVGTFPAGIPRLAVSWTGDCLAAYICYLSDFNQFVLHRKNVL